MDTMTFTKAAAGVLGAFLVFLLGKWAAEGLYHMDSHGEAAYVIEVETDDSAEEVVEVSFAELMAGADADKGEKVFKKCAACHKLEKGENSTGPYLYGVVGRAVGSADGFGYSDAVAGLDGDWTPERLSEFLTKPSAFAPGTTMSFAGLKKDSDRVNLIAFLNQHTDSPYVIEAAAEEPAAEEEAATEPAGAEEEAAAEPAAEEPAAEEEAAAEETASEEAAQTTGATAEMDAAAAEGASAADAEADAEAATEETAETTETAAVAGDIKAGAKVFKKCKACHKLEEGKNGVGPYLYGVVGRPVASLDGFKYSDALKEVGGDWTPDQLDAFLTKPRDFAPGTSMTFAGLRKEADRTNVIAYLNSIGN
ncbi:cytochrome c family protein [Rhodobacteraceae bacterium F11138]|nr:cytochrome c family protein [Rhodobacteraceae bacterium F11138]